MPEKAVHIDSLVRQAHETSAIVAQSRSLTGKNLVSVEVRHRQVETAESLMRWRPTAPKALRLLGQRQDNPLCDDPGPFHHEESCTY